MRISLRRRLLAMSAGAVTSMLLVSMLLVSMVLAAHDPPMIAIESDLTTESLKSHIFLREELYRFWFDEDPNVFNSLDDDALSEQYDRVKEFLSEVAPVHIDRVLVAPVVDFVEYQEGFEENDFLNFVAFDITYGVKGKPRQISFQWRQFETEDEAWPLELVNAVISYAGDFEEMVFSPAEPQVIWHAPRVVSSAPRKPYLPPPPPRLTLPLVTLGILAAAGLLALWFARRKPSRVFSWPAIVAVCIGAMTLSGFGQVSIRPPWASRVILPSEEEARYLFESLHRNIYRAFDYETEDEIYDALAHSIDDRLLDDVYNEVYQSLILEKEGGAVCKVKSIKVLDSEIRFPHRKDRESFQVMARWRVTGTVVHWGHSHWRTNEYRALYTLSGDNNHWRITEVEVKNQQRLTNDAPTGF